MTDRDRSRRIGPPDEEALKRSRGYGSSNRETELPTEEHEAENARARERALPPADSMEDRESISTFARTDQQHFYKVLAGALSGLGGT